jgi:large conductance mechanosensitive channel
MSMMDEFKAFALKGNVVDLAVGVIIGGAFGKIVDSVVQDLIMPIVGKVFGGFDFSSLYIVLGDNPNKLTALADLKKAGVATFAYGNFITILINFIILAWIIFMMIKAMNKVRTASEPPAPPTPEDVLLLREIRDSLKK